MTSGNKDKAEGAVDKGKGKVKQSVGDATGNKDLKREGKADEAKGHLKDAKGDFKKAVDK